MTVKDLFLQVQYITDTENQKTTNADVKKTLATPEMEEPMPQGFHWSTFEVIASTAKPAAIRVSHWLLPKYE